jgi:hypothetical protein
MHFAWQIRIQRGQISIKPPETEVFYYFLLKLTLFLRMSLAEDFNTQCAAGVREGTLFDACIMDIFTTNKPILTNFFFILFRKMRSLKVFHQIREISKHF